MKQLLFTLTLFALSNSIWGQNTFKAGWNTYNAATVIHEYTYSYTYTDSIKLTLTDSSQVFVTADSMVTLTVNFPFREKKHI